MPIKGKGYNTISALVTTSNIANNCYSMYVLVVHLR
jgi:hypothetical protein